MTHPALLILAKNPEMLADHAEAYADLISESLRGMMVHWRRRAICDIAVAVCLMLSAVFTGMAAMLWGASTAVSYQAPWLLVGIPILPLLIALGLWQFARKQSYGTEALEIVKRQVQADLAVLRQQHPL
jgi:hypothetical protein